MSSTLAFFALLRITLSQMYCDNLNCTWTVEDYTLDLCPFRNIGVNLTTTDGEFNYYFSPANNLIYNIANADGTPRYMALQLNKSKGAVNYASFDAPIEPKLSFDSNNNPIWIFQYNSQFGIEYLCDYNVDIMEIKDILEVVPNSYLMQIASQYICSGAIIPDNLGISQCVWTDETVYSSILNLSEIYGMCARFESAQQTFCVCQNQLYETGHGRGQFCGMNQYSYSSHAYDTTTNYIVWSPNIRPTLDTSTQKWTFIYPDAWNVYNRTVEWICDSQVNLEIQSYNGDTRTLRLASKYSCPPECTFIDSANYSNVLNLLPVIGNTIQYIDAELDYSFLYTPCSNEVQCYKKSVMAMRWNIRERVCDPYLAEWSGLDSEYALNYDEQENEWEFIYKNGDVCVDDPQRNIEFDIYWKCNENINDWNVTKVETITECSFAMYIESQYAC